MHRCLPRPRSRPWLALAAAAATLVQTACDRQPAPSAAATTPGQWQTFEGTWNATGTQTTIPLGANRKGASINLSGTMLLSGEGRPAAGFRAQIIAMVDNETGLVGRGVWTDERGDQVFSELKGEGTKATNRVEGKFLGGTGRYTGVTGTYEFSWQSVIETDDATIQGRAVNFKGRYQTAAAPAEGSPR